MAASKNQGGVWVATQTFACEIDGAPVIVQAGQTRVREGHPMLDTYRDAFQSVDTGVDFEVVEQATAEPGQKRGSAPTKVKPEPAEPKPEPFAAKTTPEPAKADGPLRTADLRKPAR